MKIQDLRIQSGFLTKGKIGESFLGLIKKALRYLGVGYADACCGDSFTPEGGGASYLVYTALLTQSGTDAPVATVLENTIGNIVWSRAGVGGYNGTLTGAFTLDKTYLSITQDNNNADGMIYIYRASSNVINLATCSDFSTLVDDKLYLSSIEIRVYP